MDHLPHLHCTKLTKVSLLFLSCLPTMAFADRMHADAGESLAIRQELSPPQSQLKQSALLQAMRIVNLSAPSDQRKDNSATRRQHALHAGTPIQIGISRSLQQPLIALSRLHWQRTLQGKHVAAIEITSAQAQQLRAKLGLFSVGKQTIDWSTLKLRFSGKNSPIITRLGTDFTPDHAGWSPLIEGETLRIEIELPTHLRPEQIRLHIPLLSHIDGLPTNNPAALTKSSDQTTCLLDVMCRSDATQGFKNAVNASVKMIFTEDNGGTYLCSATLIDNSFSPKKPLLWTAAHCIHDDKTAETLVTLWFYNSTACNQDSINPSSVTLQNGAWLRYTSTAIHEDATLLELKEAPPAGAYYAQWNNQPITDIGTAVTGIHHPGGKTTQYSLGALDQLDTTFGETVHLYRFVFYQGQIEGGSSGSGIFTMNSNGEYELRGALTGGTSASCGSADINQAGLYSKFSDMFDKTNGYLIKNDGFSGNFSASCEKMMLDGSILKARCQNLSGNWVDSRIDLNAHIINHYGDLSWQENGNYKMTSSACVVHQQTLHCDAQDGQGNAPTSFINLDEHITNDNGSLEYL